MLRNFLAWREKKKKAGRPQGSLLPFILPTSGVAAFHLALQQFMWEGEEATAAAKLGTTETGNNNLHIGAW